MDLFFGLASVTVLYSANFVFMVNFFPGYNACGDKQTVPSSCCS